MSDHESLLLAPTRTWETTLFSVGYPSAEDDWVAGASPGHLICGRDVLEHAQRMFQATGEHYLTVRLSGYSITSRPVLDDEAMADLPKVNDHVQMRLVKLI